MALVKRPCVGFPGKRCRNYALSGESRCSECKSQRWDNGLTGKRGSRPGWRKLRTKVATRQGWRCARCGQKLGKRWEVHHRDRNAKNDDEANLEAVHPDCHPH